MTTLSSARNTVDLRRLVLDHGLDDELAVGELVEVGGARGSGRGPSSRASSVSLPERTPRSSDVVEPGQPGLGGAGVDLPDDDVEAGSGAHLGDAGPHQAAADDTDSLDRTHRPRMVPAADRRAGPAGRTRR